MFRTEFQTAIDRDQTSSSVTLSYQSDDLMEKLKQLDFEKNLLREMKMKQLHRHYFVRVVNSGEQFFMFISICAWLARQIGHDFPQPQEFDDPNIIIGKIIKLLQEMDIPTDIPTTKIIQGAGPICIYIMDCLAAQTLKTAKQSLKVPDIKKEDAAIAENIDNDSEVILEKVEELNIFGSDESDDEQNSIFGMQLGNASHTRQVRQAHHIKDYKLEAVSDNEAWRLELERVIPNLKIVVKASSRDWRAHLEQMRSLRKNIQQASDETQMELKKLQSDISLAIDKIESREKHLNSDLKTSVHAFKLISVEMQQLNTLIKENDLEKSKIDQQLFKVTHELDNIKIQMEQRGNTMTDGSPLINIKKAIYKIKEEIADMDVKIGIMQHMINTDIIKQSTSYAELESIPIGV